MRIAVVGTHRVGKTSLVDELARAFPAWLALEEPYVELEDDGHEFSALPSVEDFELQLKRSLQQLKEAGADVLFDRAPLDFIAYASAHPEGGDFDQAYWLPRVRRAMRTLDLLVFVGIEEPDRIPVERSERPFRAAVDARLRELLLDDEARLGIPVVVAHGPVEARARQVLDHVARHSAARLKPSTSG